MSRHLLWGREPCLAGLLRCPSACRGAALRRWSRGLSLGPRRPVPSGAGACWRPASGPACATPSLCAAPRCAGQGVCLCAPPGPRRWPAKRDGRLPLLGPALRGRTCALQGPHAPAHHMASVAATDGPSRSLLGGCRCVCSGALLAARSARLRCVSAHGLGATAIHRVPALPAGPLLAPRDGRGQCRPSWGGSLVAWMGMRSSGRPVGTPSPRTTGRLPLLSRDAPGRQGPQEAPPRQARSPRADAPCLLARPRLPGRPTLRYYSHCLPLDDARAPRSSRVCACHAR